MNYVKTSGSSRRRSRRSRGRRRRIVALVLVCAAIVFAGWSWNRLRPSSVSEPLGATASTANESAPKLALLNPAFSNAPWQAHEVARLQRELHDAFAPALSGAQRWSLVVLDAGGRTIYSDRALQAVAPASVQKLVVAAAALDVLGAGFRYHTIFASQNSIAGDGTIDGNLWLVGSGDPSLRGTDVRGGVAALAQAGLRRIAGSVAVDPTALRGPEINPHWDPDDANEDYAAPTNALSIDGDTIESQKMVGGIVERFWTPVHDVPRYASAMIQRMFRQRGIAIGAPPTVARSPLDSVVLWDHRSATLRPLETHMLFYSDNHYAEQLLRTLGSEGGSSADDGGGLSVERRFLSERGIPAPGLNLEDGSGLSGDNRVAAVTLAGVLSDAQLRGGASSLYMLLPQGGRQGTLRDYDFTTALGRVRAKSGHISGVSSLAGYANTAGHGRIVFAFLINGSPGDPDAAIVRAVDRLATF
jgi:D-alanyl-D-alanine carboxypeptidase/D-alanyl-D-alanine-endopeptidase (penicillin-binding protein 4)